MQRQAQAKGEMTARSMGSHIVKLYSHGVSKVLKIDDIKKGLSKTSRKIQLSKIQWRILKS